MRQSWDTAVKHLARKGVLKDVLSPTEFRRVPSSNISRWKAESEGKYLHCEINKIISQEIELIRKMNQSSKVKRVVSGYFELCETLHSVLSTVKGVKTSMRKHRDTIVNSIDAVKEYIPIHSALNVFNLSRSSFEHYKNRLIYKCEASYFNWCVKKHPNQLLPKEINMIKTYMSNQIFKHWAKSSIYLKAVTDNKLHCGSSTFYKYCLLLGFKNMPRRLKSEDYNPIRTSCPNELWCVDVTIFKTPDGIKHYIHLLIDHYSKMILGYSIKPNCTGITTKELLEITYNKYKPNNLQLLSDAGSENVNAIVSNFTYINNIKHLIAKKTIASSNSMIEAVNKIIKHQFLYPKTILDSNHLKTVFNETVFTYNTIRPQMSLQGNTPLQTFEGKPINFTAYSQSFKPQKRIRIEQNTKIKCKKCH